MTVRIPRTGQIRLSGHISASFNQNSGSQTSMNNSACKYAMHNTSTWDPTQRSMNSAHGVVSALMLNDRYSDTSYGTNTAYWAAKEYEMDVTFNKQDTRSDGLLYASSTSRSPSVESSAGAVGHQLNAIVYDGTGAIYCNMHKNIGTGGGKFDVRVDCSTSDCRKDSRDTTSDCYVYGYPSGYLSGSRIQPLVGGNVPLGSGTQTGSTAGQSRMDPTYPYVVFGYRGRVKYPGSGSRTGTLRIKPHYLRLIATTGYE